MDGGLDEEEADVTISGKVGGRSLQLASRCAGIYPSRATGVEAGRGTCLSHACVHMVCVWRVT